MFCPKCGKEAAEGNSFCPVCGAALTADQQPAAAPQQKALPYNVLSIIGIVLSCVSLALDMYTGLTVGLAGLVVSIIALVQCRKKPFGDPPWRLSESCAAGSPPSIRFSDWQWIAGTKTRRIPEITLRDPARLVSAAAPPLCENLPDAGAAAPENSAILGVAI